MASINMFLSRSDLDLAKDLKVIKNYCMLIYFTIKLIEHSSGKLNEKVNSNEPIWFKISLRPKHKQLLLKACHHFICFLLFVTHQSQCWANKPNPQTRSDKNESEPIRTRHKYQIYFFMVFRVIGIIQSEPEPKWLSDKTRNIQNPKKKLVPNKILIFNMYPNILRYY